MAQEEIDIKLVAFGKFKSGLSAREVADELDEPYSKILRWKNELKEAEEAGTINNLIDADDLLIRRIAEETKQELVGLGADGEILEGEIEKVIETIDKHKLLSDKLATTALTLLDRIGVLSSTGGLEAKEVNLLVDSVAKLQTAFFNKPTTNVAVLNGNGSEPSDKKVAFFQSIKRD